MDTTKPRIICSKCNDFEYCEKSSGMPRLPENTMKAFNKRHKNICDGELSYKAGIMRPQKGIGPSSYVDRLNAIGDYPDPEDDMHPGGPWYY